jgi:hypothetical protein
MRRRLLVWVVMGDMVQWVTVMVMLLRMAMNPDRLFRVWRFDWLGCWVMSHWWQLVLLLMLRRRVV